MGRDGTDSKVFDQVIEFAKAIGMVPIPIHKEQNGYILNSLLMPLLNAATELLVKGVSDPEAIDKTWMICSKSPAGPFAVMDVVGMNTGI